MPVLAARATIGIVPAETEAPPANDFADSAEANIYGDHNGLTNAQIGALVGAIIGAIILILLLIWCCLAQRARQRRRMYRRSIRRHTASSGEASYTSSFIDVPPSPRKPSATRKKHGRAPPPPPPPLPKERIPGGPKYPTYRAIPIPNPRRNPSVRHAL